MADVFTKNTISGQVGWVPEEYLEHPWFKDQLIKVDEGTKPTAEGLVKPTTAEGATANKATKEAATLGTPDGVE